MRFIFIVILSVFAFSCKKDENNLGDKDQNMLKAGFSYVNPQGKEFGDSLIVLPVSGSIMNIDNPLIAYGGATFKNNAHWTWGKGRDLTKDVVLSWKVIDTKDNKVVKTSNMEDLQLELYELGKYKLIQYTYASVAYRDIAKPLDSVSKLVEIVNKRQIDSIGINLLSFSSPYLNWNLNSKEPVDVFVSIYRNKGELTLGKAPLFKSKVIRGVKSGATALKFDILRSTTLSSFSKPINSDDDLFIQLNVEQNGKTYTLIDNERGLVIQRLQSGYLSKDNSHLLEEFKLAYGKMALIINTSYQFMQ
ncbi:hypothetical protein OHD16_09750 [Sphingobacterium sp. ML3W]|uniref:hypothetical protein n=1 Tax=Sphingobacterium sp. ML3W TaxID=1538644 RepID=UPI00249A6CF1|nr:hypothetical protein [Sphingobacterium sp. ML3W]WFA80240.1 hypothetical protein OGI71_02890 [Sphingobacterium sp. ML3W]